MADAVHSPQQSEPAQPAWRAANGAEPAAASAPAQVLMLQRSAGNRAVTALLQREADTLEAAMTDQAARRLHEAMSGWGTDEDTIYATFSGRTQEQVDGIAASYRRLFDGDLMADLTDELTRSELLKLGALAPMPTSEPAGELGTMIDRMDRAGVAARRLHEAMEGWGTDEDAIFATLTGRSSAERREIGDQYLLLYDHTLEHDLREELSGAELTEALALLGQGMLKPQDELYQAFAGAGTDEERVFRVVDKVAGDQAAAKRLIDGFTADHGGLLARVHDEMSGSELEHVRDALGQAGHVAACTEVLKGADPDLLHPIESFEFLTPQERLRLIRRVHTETVVGPDDEDVLERIWTSAGMDREAALHQELWNASRDRGAELPEELTTFGTFRNEYTQDMFEGGITGAEGFFTWTLVDDVLRVRVPVKFTAKGGATIPWAQWQADIDNTWNQFAAVEPGGMKVPIIFSMVNDQSAEREVDVVKNKVPGTWTQPDRANAGLFFEVMRDQYVVPHEFGHFVGLEDEYMRTHDDFKKVTGTDKVGPPNNSGKTPEDIAGEIHTELHKDPASTRRSRVSTVLLNVGLLVNNGTRDIPQQGDFAQAVMAAYDAEHGSLKEDLIDELPEDDRWTIQSVFSYASGTVMGNPVTLGDHTHEVAPRHLREFIRIVKRRHPSKIWTMGPK